jgi:hypothetical protein
VDRRGQYSTARSRRGHVNTADTPMTPIDSADTLPRAMYYSGLPKLGDAMMPTALFRGVGLSGAGTADLADSAAGTKLPPLFVSSRHRSRRRRLPI